MFADRLMNRQTDGHINVYKLTTLEYDPSIYELYGYFARIKNVPN